VGSVSKHWKKAEPSPIKFSKPWKKFTQKFRTLEPAVAKGYGGQEIKKAPRLGRFV